MYKFVNPTDTNTIQNVTSLQTLFNGNNLDKELSDDTGSFVTLTVSGRSNLNQRINTIDVPGLDGTNEYSNPTFDIREITIKYKLTDQTKEGFRQRYNRLNSLLDGSKKELAFTDEDAVFYATLQTNEVPEEETNSVIGNLIFLCSDPFKYGPEQQINFTDNVATVVNDGTVDTSPIFQLEVLSPITFAMIQNQNGDYMMIGKPVNIEDQEPFEKYERLLYSDGDTLSGWSIASPGEINGNITGSMETDGTRFQASDYGKGSSWHGPAIKTSLSEPISDFRLTTFVSFLNERNPSNVGRVEVYLLDVNGNQVAKIAMKDTMVGQALSWGEARAGDNDNNYFLISEYGDKMGNWNDFVGHMRIERVANHWKAYFAKVDTTTGRHHTRRFANWVDSQGVFDRTVAQVVVHVGEYKNHLTPSMGVYSLNIFKINQQTDGIPYIADQGDTITFNHEFEEVYINGEYREELLTDLGVEFFKLSKGKNQLILLPHNKFNVSGYYRERYK
ncbi:distal tail protein Dit [Virgibacillus salarius]